MRDIEKDFSLFICRMRIGNEIWAVSGVWAWLTRIFWRKSRIRAFYAWFRMQLYSIYSAAERLRWRCGLCSMCMRVWVCVCVCVHGMWVFILVRRLRGRWHGCNWNMNFCDMLGCHRCLRRHRTCRTAIACACNRKTPSHPTAASGNWPSHQWAMWPSCYVNMQSTWCASKLPI